MKWKQIESAIIIGVVIIAAIVAGAALATQIYPPDCPEIVTQGVIQADTIINTGGDDGTYCVTAVLGMQKYDAFVGECYSDSNEARRVYDLLAQSGIGHQQKFEHGGWTFRGYLIKVVKSNFGEVSK